MLYSRLFAAGLSLAVALCAPLSLAKVAPPAALTWQSIQGKTAVEVLERLESDHYRKQRFDDAMSSQLLDSYLNSLDPTRLFLLQSDVDSFTKYRTTLDDAMRKGDLEPGFVIFRTYQQRVVRRLEKLLATLPATIAAMNFKTDEYIDLSREEKPSWPQTAAEADEQWRLRLKNSVLSLRLAGKKDADITKLLEKRYRSQLNRVQQTSGDDVFQIYLNALTELYDPHSNYFSPRTSKNFNINMSLKLEGIGAVLEMQDEFTKVSRLVPAGPAEKQGELKPADRIVGVGEGRNGEIQDVVGWRLDDVVDRIRGPKGSVVRLEIIPASAKTEDERKVIAITRNEVKLEEQSAQKQVLEFERGGRKVKLGVIQIPTFYIDFEAARRGDPNYKSTTRDVQKLLSELEAEDVQGIVIDLRDNGGGSLQEANQLTWLFIESGPTVQIRNAYSRVPQLEGKPRATAYYDGPLAILINRLSASASEIFAGAIQDYQRGLIIGDQSFGKGTVQQLIDLQHGELKLTESKFYRISGDSTQHRGVIPDIVFPTTFDPKEVGESALEHALAWDRIASVPHRIYYDLRTAVPTLQARHRERAKTDPDFVFLTTQLALSEKERQMTRLSLNEAVRRQKLQEDKAQQLALENQRRIAKGEKPLEQLDDSDADAGDANTAARPQDSKDKTPDPLLQEAGRVLVDALPVYQRPAFADRYR
jgi:carboxyl-terminal processing protease